MNFFRRLFKRKPTVQCPRCLGKGRVDWDDIKRLGKELKWGPGRCAYCNGTGKVDPALMSKVAVGETYLTTNLPYAERKGVIDGNYIISGTWMPGKLLIFSWSLFLQIELQRIKMRKGSC